MLVAVLRAQEGLLGIDDIARISGTELEQGIGIFQAALGEGRLLRRWISSEVCAE